MVGVITSYSIHYTKLYDADLPFELLSPVVGVVVHPEPYRGIAKRVVAYRYVLGHSFDHGLPPPGYRLSGPGTRELPSTC